MTDIRNTIDPGVYALGYDSGFSAGMIEGRKKGVEEAEAMLRKWSKRHELSGEALPDGDPRHMSRVISSVYAACAYYVRSLITTGDASEPTT